MIYNKNIVIILKMVLILVKEILNSLKYFRYNEYKKILYYVTENVYSIEVYIFKDTKILKLFHILFILHNIKIFNVLCTLKEKLECNKPQTVLTIKCIQIVKNNIFKFLILIQNLLILCNSLNSNVNWFILISKCC